MSASTSYAVPILSMTGLTRWSILHPGVFRRCYALHHLRQGLPPWTRKRTSAVQSARRHAHLHRCPCPKHRLMRCNATGSAV